MKGWTNKEIKQVKKIIKCIETDIILSTLGGSKNTMHSSKQNTLLEKEEMYTKQLLRQRGWTDKLLKTFLSSPDKIRQNLRYPNAPSVKLFKKNKIHKIEQLPTFKKAFEKAKKHRQIAQKGVQTKRQKMMSYVIGMKIELPDFKNEKDLYKKACKSYNRLQASYGNYTRVVNVTCDVEFLNRISMNYLRHCCTSYEENLDKIAGKTGCREAYCILRKKINREILRKFPFLSSDSTLIQCI